MQKQQLPLQLSTANDTAASKPFEKNNIHNNKRTKSTNEHEATIFYTEMERST